MAYILIPIMIGLVLGVIAAAIDRDAIIFIPVFIGTVVVSGLFSLMIYAGDQSERKSNERKTICAEKGGVVENDTYLCIVNGKPIEYSPGEWKYDR